MHANIIIQNLYFIKLSCKGSLYNSVYIIVISFSSIDNIFNNAYM